MEQDTLFWIWLAEALGPAYPETGKILRFCEHPYTLFQADAEELERFDWLTPASVQRLSNKNLERAYEILRYCQEHHVSILHWDGADYPARLKDLSDPPVVLYCLGKMPPMDDRLVISMVGTRQMSEYGRKNAYTIGFELAYAGVVVVSGMALGNDSVAAVGALEAGGQTIAVLGCGIDIVYPATHRPLMEKIAKCGAVITEYPPGTEAIGYHFPVRNRIISGLSHGTLVIEANAKSGALITAGHALRQGRQVFAIPANLDGLNAEGSNKLLHDGAIMVMSAADILAEYPEAPVAAPVLRLRRSRVKVRFTPEVLLKYGVTDRVYGEVSEPSVSGEAPQESRIPVRAKLTRVPAKPDHDAADKSENKKAAQPEPKPFALAHQDSSMQELAALNPFQREIFDAIPLEGAVPLDALTRNGHKIGEVIAALTVLEVRGFIHTLPGGLYTRA